MTAIRRDQRSFEEKIDAVQQKLTMAVESLITGDDWRRAIEFAARFRARSFNNTLLIWAQHAAAHAEGRVPEPFPTYVAGFQQWHQLGRHVMKGQSGYQILAPVTAPMASADPADPDSWRRLAPGDQPAPGETVRSRMIGVKPAHVWDISMTQGPPIAELPQPVLLTGQAPEGLWDGLAQIVSERGFNLRDAPDADALNGANGVTSWTNRTVQVRSDMDDAARARTLSHEVGHIVLHEPGNTDAVAHRGIAEVEAESVALMVGAAHGMDTNQYTIPYVSTWASRVPGQDPIKTIQDTAARVRIATLAIIDRLNSATVPDGTPPGLNKITTALNDQPAAATPAPENADRTTPATSGQSECGKELAHVILHVENGVVAGCRGVIEVEAESVAHLVLGVHHVDTGGYTFPYVAAWAYPIATAEQVPMSEIVARTGARVMRAADEIITATTAAATMTAADPLAPATGRAALLTRQVADLRDQARTANRSAVVEREVLLGVVADGHDFYRRQVGSSWVPDYLAERGLGVAVVRSRQLGYAPAGWTAVTDHLRSLGYTDAHIEAAGMATRARTGRLIDRMRDRVIIPLRDTRGDVVGFTGRITPGQVDTDAPKYLNTPTTAIFQKAQVLYGLWENHPRTDRGTPVICEGPLDAIAVDLLAGQHQLNVFGVAASGTAFTPDHARLLESWIQEGRPICLAFDADPAGVKATEKTWRLLTDAGWRGVSAAELPDGHDPAALYAREPARLLESLTTARPAGVVIAERQIASADLAGNVAKEVAAFRDLFPLAARLPPEGRPDYVRMLTDTLRIDPPLASMLIAETGGVIMDRSRQFDGLDGRLGSSTDRPRMIVLDPPDTGDRRSVPAAPAASDREPRRTRQPAPEWRSSVGGPPR